MKLADFVGLGTSDEKPQNNRKKYQKIVLEDLAIGAMLATGEDSIHSRGGPSGEGRGTNESSILAPKARPEGLRPDEPVGCMLAKRARKNSGAKEQTHPAVPTKGCVLPVQAREANESECPPLGLSYLIPEPVGHMLDGRPIYRTLAGDEVTPLTEAEREAFEEKAAIIEFESGLVDYIEDGAERRAMAEKIALELGMIVTCYTPL